MYRAEQFILCQACEKNTKPKVQSLTPSFFLPLQFPIAHLYPLREIIALVIFVILIGFQYLTSTPALAQGSQETPLQDRTLDLGQSQHGFSKFDTMPTIPGKNRPTPMPYYDADPRSKSKSLDQIPKGLFLEIVTAEGFEETLEFRRGHLYYPIHPTEHFNTDALAIFVVFRVFKHIAPYQIIGRLFPEEVDGLPSNQWTDEDVVYLALEDESGYLKLFPPSKDGWKPGRYRVEIFVGYEASTTTQMGNLHFTMSPHS